MTLHNTNKGVSLTRTRRIWYPNPRELLDTVLRKVGSQEHARCLLRIEFPMAVRTMCLVMLICA